MTRGVAVGSGPVVAVGSGGAAGIIAVGIGVGTTVGGGGAVGIGVAVGIAASIGGATVGSGVEVGTGIGTSVGNGVAVGIGVTVGGITSDMTGAATGNSSTCTGPVDARRASAIASTSAWGSLPRSGATPVTA
jgi:hypothetical protein